MDIIEILKVILLGIVEGITEWLPVSSTGHMLLVDAIPCLGLNASEEFKEMFFVVIQLGAILAVVVMFFKKLFPWHKQTANAETGEKAKIYGSFTKRLFLPGRECLNSTDSRRGRGRRS